MSTTGVHRAPGAPSAPALPPSLEVPSLAQQREDAAVSGVVRVHARTDPDRALAGRFRQPAFNDPDAGRLAIDVSIDIRRPTWLAHDLHTAMGVSRTASGTGRNTDADWQLLPPWLIARRITDIAVVHAERLTASILEPLLLLSAQTGTRLWLLQTPPRTPARLDYLDEWTPVELGWTDFRDLWADVPDLFPPRGRQHSTPAHARSCPMDTASAAAATDTSSTATDTTGQHEPDVLPAADFLAFRAACRDHLPPAQHRWVDAHLLAAARTTFTWLDTGVDLTGSDGPELLGRWLHENYDTITTQAQWLTFIRGVQVALFRRGLHCQVDLGQLTGLAPHVPSRAHRTPAMWSRLRIYRQPHRGAICALAVLDLTAERLRALRLEQLGTDATSLTLDDGTLLHLEPGSETYLQAMRLLRLSHGAPPPAPLLTDVDGTSVTDRAIGRIVRTARLDTGLLVTSRQLEARKATGAAWAGQWGISLQPLSLGGER